MYDTSIERGTRETSVDWRPMAASLAIAVVVIASVVLLLGFRSLPSRPEGVIGYRVEDAETWVHADGRPADSVAHVGHVSEAHVGLGAVTGAVPWEFPAADGRTLAYLDASQGGELFVSTGRAIHHVGAVTDGQSPDLVLGDKAAAASAGGVPFIAAWSPDARYLAYGSLKNTPETLHVTTVDGSANWTFALDEGYIGEAVWSPDGRYLAVSSYAEGQHGLYVLDTHDWSFRKLLDGCHIVWAPDSQWIAVHRDPGDETGVWLVSPAGASNRREITGEVRAFPMAWLAE